MRLVFTSYSGAPAFNHPQLWLKRIAGYTGILEALAKQGHEVIGIEHINYEGELVQNGARYLFQKQTGPVQYFPARLHKTIRALKPDLVFINGSIFPLQLIQLRKSLGRSARIIVIHRSEKPYRGIRGYLQRKANASVDAYLFTSEHFKHQWANTIDTGKMHIIMHGSSIFEPAEKIARESLSIEGYPLFLWVGRLDNNKDPMTALKAFSGYIKTNPAAKLYMIYHEQPLFHEMMRYINENDMNNNVFMVGKIPHEALGDWYSAADYIISCSHYEGGGISLLEAMSCGCIPIVTRIPSFISITADGTFGHLYPPGDADSLLSILKQCENVDIGSEHKKIIEHFKKELSFEAIAGKIEQLIINIR